MMFKRFRFSIIFLTIIAVGTIAAPFMSPVVADQPKELTAEQIAEGVILISGSRLALGQIRRNGIERGRMSRMTPEGRPEESRYEMRFMHGDKIAKDKIRMDQKTAQNEISYFSLEGRVFGLINGSPFTPRAETAADLLSQQVHSLEALLRYKENESKLTSAGKDKQQG